MSVCANILKKGVATNAAIGTRKNGKRNKSANDATHQVGEGGCIYFVDCILLLLIHVVTEQQLNSSTALPQCPIAIVQFLDAAKQP
jgi:hypothetical protein